MKNYPVVAVLWEDHIEYTRTKIPTHPDEIMPTLSLGVIIKETDKVIVLVHEVEPYEEEDDVSFMIILKSTIVAIQEFGQIELRDIRD